MGHISFVILNYKTYQESIACAKSILGTQTYEDYSIIIVDNGSGNESVRRLKGCFCDEPNVHIIEAEQNLGFARGNNLGIDYARDTFDPDFIVVANSDILFEQPDYCEELVRIYKRRRFDLLGGDIVDASRTQHFNPVARERIYSIGYMRKQVFVSWAKSVLFRMIKFLHLKKAVAGHYDKSMATREVGGRAVAANERIEHEMQGVLLHGCCLTFSRDFFQSYAGFYDRTFLYAEEEILYYLAMIRGMTVLYSPHIGCIHKEAVSTNSLYQDFCDAKIFYFSHITKSYRLFLKLMKQTEKMRRSDA